MPFCITNQEFFGLDEGRPYLPGIELQTDQLTPGPITFAVATHPTRTGWLFQGSISQVIQYRAHPIPDHYYFTVVADQQSIGRFRNQIMPEGSINVLHPDDQINHISAKGVCAKLIIVHRQLVEELAQSRLGRDLSNDPLPKALYVGRHATHSFRERISQLVDDWNESDSDQLVEDIVIATLAAPEIDAFSCKDLSQLQLFRKACSLAGETTLPATLGELSRILDCSERTINSVFHRFCALSPKRYLRALRLNKIRRDLLQAEPEDRIADIFSSNGLEYSGVFAAEYAKHFGELPSTTFRKPGVTLPSAPEVE